MKPGKHEQNGPPLRVTQVPLPPHRFGQAAWAGCPRILIAIPRRSKTRDPDILARQPNAIERPPRSASAWESLRTRSAVEEEDDEGA